MKKIGFIVNPIAGMGGAVGLKGTDGKEILKKAIELGAEPVAPRRASVFLRELVRLGIDADFLVAPKAMGEYESKGLLKQFTVIGEVGEETTAEDTIRIAKEMVDKGADILVFVGGDGTARDVLKSVDTKVPILGVPSGVKMYSGVFAATPQAAASMLKLFIEGKAGIRYVEVLDIDEEAFRENRLSVKLYGYALTPYDPRYVQESKEPTVLTDSELDNQKAIARYVVEEMEKDCLYILGPGTTVKAIADVLGVKKTLLGVDVVYNGKIIAKDVNEKILLNLLNKYDKVKIIVSPIGAQGFIFGRGNQQISSRVLKKVGRNNVIVVATKAKIVHTPVLRVDTGDPELDSLFKGYIRVIIDYREEKMVKVI